MGHCSCGAHSCATEKRVDAKVSVFHEYGKVIFSLLLLVGGIIMNALDLAFFREGYVSLIWYIVAYLPVGIPVMKEAWESIREKDYFSEFTLMVIATLGAFYIGEYPEGVAVMLFYTVGELFQDKAVDKAKRNIGALLDVRPEKALVLREGNLVLESPKKIKVGEIIEIKAGERVPLDGTMQNEVAAFNTAALTGESAPRNIRKGEEVLAGMIVTDKVIRLEVTRPFDKSAPSASHLPVWAWSIFSIASTLVVVPFMKPGTILSSSLFATTTMQVDAVVGESTAEKLTVELSAKS